MGEAIEPYKVKLFLAIMYHTQEAREKALSKFFSRYGDPERGAVTLEVNKFTKYYDGEMGIGLKKDYIVMEKLIDRTTLPDIKEFTNQIEEDFSKNGMRIVNLDPGYISRDKLVLASTKNFFQRVYLTKGIYAEITMHYRRGRFRYFSWTYPDYKNPDVIRILEKARAQLVNSDKPKKTKKTKKRVENRALKY